MNRDSIWIHYRETQEYTKHSFFSLNHSSRRWTTLFGELSVQDVLHALLTVVSHHWSKTGFPLQVRVQFSYCAVCCPDLAMAGHSEVPLETISCCLTFLLLKLFIGPNHFSWNLLCQGRLYGVKRIQNFLSFPKSSTISPSFFFYSSHITSAYSLSDYSSALLCEVISCLKVEIPGLIKKKTKHNKTKTTPANQTKKANKPLTKTFPTLSCFFGAVL